MKGEIATEFGNVMMKKVFCIEAKLRLLLPAPRLKLFYTETLLRQTDLGDGKKIALKLQNIF